MRERDRDRDRETETERQRERGRERQKERHREKETETERDTEREGRERERKGGWAQGGHIQNIRLCRYYFRIKEKSKIDVSLHSQHAYTPSHHTTAVMHSYKQNTGRIDLPYLK